MVYTSDKNGTDLDAKATPIDADSIVLFDSADSNRAKKTTFAQLTTWIESFTSYFNKTTAVLNDISNINAGSPSDGQHLTYDNATSKWVNTTSTVSDADETTQGGVEEATTAEVDAGTASGTVAKLFITPAKLAASIFGLQLPTSDEKDALAGTGTPNTTNKYVTNDDVSAAAGSGLIVRASGTALPALDGSALTDLPASSRVSTTSADVAIASSTTETTLFTYTVPAGGFGTTNGYRFTVFVDDIELSSGTLDIRLKYGSTTLATYQFGGTVSSVSHVFEGTIVADGDTALQKGFIKILGDGVAAVPMKSGAATEDSTGALALLVTAQFSASAGNNTLDAQVSLVERIA